VLVTSRGCVYSCSFCFRPWDDMRLRSAAGVFQEIAYLYERYAIRDFYIVDDIFNVHLKRALEVFDRLLAARLGVRLYFVNGLRADTVTEEFVDRAIAGPNMLAVASTAHPDTLRPAFVAPGRFERIVEVIPSFPGDVVAALQIHARAAEKRAGRTLFEGVDWEQVVTKYRDATVGDWVRLLHGTLRHKARCEAALEPVGPVTTNDLLSEVERFQRVSGRLPRVGGGFYV